MMHDETPGDGTPIRLHGEASDFGQLFNLVPQAIALADAQIHRLVVVNDSFCELSGYTRAELLGQTHTALALYSEDSRKRLTEALERSDTVNGWELSLKTKDDETRNASVFARRIRMAGRDLSYLVFVDETDRRRLESHLQQTQKMEALGTMVAGIAHEINNPVNLITFNIDLLKKVWRDVLPVLEAADPKHGQRKYGGLTCRFLADNVDQLHHDMYMAAGHISKIVTDLKNFSKKEEITDTAPLSLNEAVKNALRLAQPAVKASGIGVALQLADRLPLMVGNLHNIEQIILNLVLNAIQATESATGRIRIQTGQDPGENHIWLSVADNGRGIAPSIRDKIFDPFVTDRLNAGGTGLGLAVTYSLTRAHGGEIHFETNAGAGTVFTVSFPVKRRPRGSRILVVDDEKWIREFLTATLTQDRPYRVDEAANGVEACIKLGAYRPDLLILDMFMPHMDGLEVCRTIRKTPELSAMQVLLSTGFPGHPKLEEAAQLGFTEVFFKPIKIEEFLDKVDRVLGRAPEELPARAGSAAAPG